MATLKPKISISAKEKKVIVSILEKIEREKKNAEVRIIGFNSLFKSLNKDEKILDSINHILATTS